MRMAVMPVMGVPMLVLEELVQVFVLVALAQMKPHARTHEQPGDEQLGR